MRTITNNKATRVVDEDALERRFAIFTLIFIRVVFAVCFSGFVKPKKAQLIRPRFLWSTETGLFHLFNNGLEGIGVVQGEVGQDLAVDFDTRLVQLVHEHAV